MTTTSKIVRFHELGDAAIVPAHALIPYPDNLIPEQAAAVSRKKDLLLELGADHVIATEEEDLAGEIRDIVGDKGVELIYDPIAGALAPVIAKTFPFGEIVEAQRFMESNRQIGKIVVTNY